MASVQATLSLNDPSLFREACFVNGEWIAAASGETVPVTNPANDALLGQIPDISADETHAAIDAANAALPAWRARPAKERSAIMRRWFELCMEHQEDLAQLMTAEQGKPLAEARGEVAYGASFIEWYAEECKRAYGEVIPQHMGDRRLLTVKQPVGVFAAITPWNFPMAMITRKCAPGLAVGCTCVVRPASQTPYTALALAALAERAGMPKGVFNVVTGNHFNIGGALCESKIVRKLSFTGSTPVGKILIRQCADTVKRMSMELGGHAPLIIFDDADLDKAVQGAIACKFRNAGQTCVCTNRIFVQDGIYDAFAAKFTEAVAAMKVAPGDEEGSVIGPLIEPKAMDKVRAHVEDAVAGGAKVLTGGEKHELGGLFHQPTVLGECNTSMKIASEETFGPVAPLFRFQTEEEVIKLANDSDVGLASYFYSRDLGRVFRVAEALETGLVGVNDGVIATEVAPFGGIKESGLGNEGGHHGMDEYLEVKYISLGGITG